MKAATLGDVLRRSADQRGDWVAISFNGERRMTFGDLDLAANRMANAFADLGLDRGDRIAIFLANRPEYFTALFALARAGLVAVPMNRRLAPTEAARVAADARVSYLITEPAHSAVAEAVSAVPGVRGAIMVADGHTSLGASDHLFSDLERRGSPADPRVNVDDDEMQAIHYTSGTSGAPKGVMRSHAANLGAALGALAAVPTAGRDAWFYTIPMHSAGVYNFAIAPLVRGATVLITDRFDTSQTLSLCASERITMLHMVPTQYEMMVRAEGAARPNLPHLKTLLWGGSPMATITSERVEGWLGLPPLGVYGATEFTAMTYSNVEIYRSGRFSSVGLPCDLMEIRVVNEAGAEVPRGDWGELLVRGSLLMDGYFDKPEVSAAALTPDGWYRTGDWCREDQDGAIAVTGRIAETILSGGENVFPLEVENVIMTMAGIVEAAVAGAPDDVWGQAVTAFVVRSDQSISESDVVNACRKELAAFKAPRSVIFLDELPKNALGKVEKRDLVRSLKPA
jgi:long-chain acyl-CoA synthetase